MKTTTEKVNCIYSYTSSIDKSKLKCCSKDDTTGNMNKKKTTFENKTAGNITNIDLP